MLAFPTDHTPLLQFLLSSFHPEGEGAGNTAADTADQVEVERHNAEVVAAHSTATAASTVTAANSASAVSTVAGKKAVVEVAAAAVAEEVRSKSETCEWALRVLCWHFA